MPDIKLCRTAFERWRQGDLKRRDFLTVLGASGAALGLMGGPFSPRAWAGAVKNVRFDGWGGVVSAAFEKYAFKPYTRATGIEVISGTFGGSDEFLARVRASQPGAYNVAHLSGEFDYLRFKRFGFASVLDERRIPNLKNVIGALTQNLRKLTHGTLSAVPYDYGLTGLAYNRKYISEEEIREKGAHILVDPKYKRKIGGWQDWRTRIWYAALAAGQNPNAIADMKAVWAMVRAHRDLTLKYWSSGAELMSLLAEEEIWVSDAWSGRIAALQGRGFDIGFYQPPGGNAWQECIFVLKDSPMAACEELLNFMLEPAVAIAVAEGQSYPPALDPTKVKLTEKIRKLPGFMADGRMDGMGFFDPEYWNAHEYEWSRAFSRIQKGF